MKHLGMDLPHAVKFSYRAGLSNRLLAEVDLSVAQRQPLAVHRAGGDGELLRVDPA
jgi:hypothetical protein